MNAKFLLLLGVSGVGKTSIIKELLKLDNRFVYISPFVTRPLRDGETDKISVTNEELEKQVNAGEILAVNDIYGIRYGTPRSPIKDAFGSGMFPLLDWPVKRLNIMEEEFGDRLFRVYIEPPSITELKTRLGQDSRDESGHRLRAAISELEMFWSGDLTGKYDIRIVADGNLPTIAKYIYAAYTAE